MQHESFDIMERTRMAQRCTNMKIACARRVKPLFFSVKYATLWRFCRLRRHAGFLSSQTPIHTGTWDVIDIDQKHTVIEKKTRYLVICGKPLKVDGAEYQIQLMQQRFLNTIHYLFFSSLHITRLQNEKLYSFVWKY